MIEFIHEWKKLIVCLLVLAFLLAVRHVTGQDTTPWVEQTLDAVMVLLGAGALKYSVLSTTEREKLSQKKNKIYSD